MATKVKLVMKPTNEIIKVMGVDEGGVLQQALTSEIYKLSQPYTPMDAGNLIRSAVVGKDFIRYDSPYARVHWFGKVMAGSAPKEATDIDMKYQGAPMRGPKWIERMWDDKGDEVLKALSNIGGRK